ncbi:hypothetical protein Tco_0376648, partial [Tanacetum coccineum]
SETDKKKRNLKSKSFRTESVSDMWRKFSCLFCSPKKGKKLGNGKGKENRLSFSPLGNYVDDGTNVILFRIASFSKSQRHLYQPIQISNGGASQP